MAAAEYYGTAPGRPDNQSPFHNDPHSPPSPIDHSKPVSPVSAEHQSSSLIDKPLPPPHQSTFPPTFPPTHSDYDPYTSHHHPTSSVDTSYNPHGFDKPPVPLHSHSYSASSLNQDQMKYGDPYAEHIPLHNTGASAAEAGGINPTGKSKKRRPPSAFFRAGVRRPWFCWIISAAQICVFIGEIIRNGVLTGSPIAIKPTFNPMIGPSTHVLINMGARFVPCMKTIPGVTDRPDAYYACPNTTTTNIEAEGCTLADWCGFGGSNIPKQYGGKTSNDSQPDQWYRFIIPMFLHAGIIHIALNLVLQLRLGSDMEREIGALRFAVVYFSAGIFGFALGGNFAPLGIASCGASGSLFGIFALVLLDLIWTWKERDSPRKDFAFLMLDFVICFVIGLLPGLDNFSHIGGFLMGLTLGLTVLHSPPAIRQKTGSSDPPYTPMTSAYPPGADSGIKKFNLKAPVSFFKGRKPLWWAWWIVRAAFLTAALVSMIMLLQNFYTYNKKCGWCKYLSCLPVSNWCDLGGLTVTNTTSSGNPARMLARGVGGTLDLLT